MRGCLGSGSLLAAEGGLSPRGERGEGAHHVEQRDRLGESEEELQLLLQLLDEPADDLLVRRHRCTWIASLRRLARPRGARVTRSVAARIFWMTLTAHSDGGGSVREDEGEGTASGQGGIGWLGRPMRQAQRRRVH